MRYDVAIMSWQKSEVGKEKRKRH